MGITDTLRQAGFKPEANTDGEFERLTGQYKCDWVTLRKESKDNGEWIQAEWMVEETIDGTPARPSQYPHFRKRYYLDNPENVGKLVNDAFTAGIALDTSSDEALFASFPNVIGKKVFIRGWASPQWQDKDGKYYFKSEADTRGLSENPPTRTIQQMVIRQAKNAKPRKPKAGAVPF